MTRIEVQDLALRLRCGRRAVASAWVWVWTTPLLALMLLAAPTAQAQMLKEPALEALYQADKTLELQRLAEQRLSARADDAQAVLALALAALARDDAPARQAALSRAEACVQAQPQAPACHYAQGLLLGVQAMSEGMLKAARSAGTVRAAFEQALALEPAWFPARSALVEFFLQAPGIMGGSQAKAQELARSAPGSEQARALDARIALYDKKYEQALEMLSGLSAVRDSAVARDVFDWGVNAGLALVNAGQADKAQPYFERLQRDKPEQSAPAYCLARVRGEQGAHAEALALYAKASGLAEAERWPIDYRVGLLQQQMGRLDAAKASFTRFVAAGKGRKSSISDARKRIEQMGG